MIKEKAYIATVVKIFTLGAILVRSIKRSGKILDGKKSTKNPSLGRHQKIFYSVSDVVKVPFDHRFSLQIKRKIYLKH